MVKDVPGLGLRDVTEVGYRTLGDEFWNEYLLDDGTRIRIKLVVTEVARVEGEFDSDGKPLYLVNSTNVTVVKPS